MFNKIRLAYLDDLEEELDKDKVVIYGPAEVDTIKLLTPYLGEAWTLSMNDNTTINGTLVLGSRPARIKLQGTGGTWSLPFMLGAGFYLIIDPFNKLIKIGEQ